MQMVARLDRVRWQVAWDSIWLCKFRLDSVLSCCVVIDYSMMYTHGTCFSDRVFNLGLHDLTTILSSF